LLKADDKHVALNSEQGFKEFMEAIGHVVKRDVKEIKVSG
jgi:hypothetical protein